MAVFGVHGIGGCIVGVWGEADVDGDAAALHVLDSGCWVIGAAAVSYESRFVFSVWMSLTS